MRSVRVKGMPQAHSGHPWQQWLSARLGTREIHQFWRKQRVLLANMTARKAFNAALRLTAYMLRHPGLGGVPVHIKVDVAPQCQLRCPICIHGSMEREERNSLPRPMALDTFRTVVDQVRGRTLAMSLYNLGEPLMNKELPSMIRYAADADINTYITTNFSMPMSDQKLRELADSGLTLLIVAVDGICVETYGKQRIKGRWNLIDDNLRRFAKMRGKKGVRMMLQYIVFDHNRHEVPLVNDYCREVGIDDVLVFEGATQPWLVQYAPRAGWLPKRKKKLPLCGWPYLSSLVGADGNVYGCCHYRMDENYLRQNETKPLGNIHDRSMGEIYAGASYRTARKFVSNPAKHGPALQSFCSGCPVVQDGAPG